MVDLVAPRPSTRVPSAGGRTPITDDDPALRRSGWVWGLLRLAMGWVFLWAFLDRFFGLGFGTCRITARVANDPSQVGGIDYLCDASFLQGGSAIHGFLTTRTARSATGDWFSWMAPDNAATQNIWDLIFMFALLGAAVTLLLGILVRLGAIGAVILLVLIHLAGSVWPTGDPFLTYQLVYAVVLVGIAVADAGRFLGFGRWWTSLPLIERAPMLH